MNRLKELRKKSNFTQKEIANIIGIAQNTYSCWENGKIRIDNASLQKLADFFNVSVDYLLGRDEKTLAAKYPGEPMNVLPIIGKIHAGYGGIAIEEFLDEVQELPSSVIKGYNLEDLFVLEVSGNSMYPQFLEGDRVLVHRQTSVNSGDIAVILYNGDEATVKQMRYANGEDWVELIPKNPEYPTKRIEGADLQLCRVLGKVIYLFRKI